MAQIVAIDPRALVLSGSAYIRLTLPDPAPDELEVEIAELRELAQTLGVEEKRLALTRAKALGAFASALERVLSEEEGSY